MKIREIAYKYNIDEYLFDNFIRKNNLEYIPNKRGTGAIPDHLVVEYVRAFKTGIIRTEEENAEESRKQRY